MLRKLWFIVLVTGMTFSVSGCSIFGGVLNHVSKQVDASTSTSTSSQQFSDQPIHYVWEAPKKNSVVMITLQFNGNQIDGKWQVDFYNLKYGKQLNENDFTIHGKRQGNRLTLNLSSGSPDTAVMTSDGFELYDHSVQNKTYVFHFKKASVADFNKDVQSLQMTP